MVYNPTIRPPAFTTELRGGHQLPQNRNPWHYQPVGRPTPEAYYNPFAGALGGNRPGGGLGVQPYKQKEAAETAAAEQIVAEVIQEKQREGDDRPSAHEIAVEARRKAYQKYHGDSALGGIIDKLSNFSIIGNVVKALTGEGGFFEQAPQPGDAGGPSGYFGGIGFDGQELFYGTAEEAARSLDRQDRLKKALGVESLEGVAYSASSQAPYHPQTGVATDESGFSALNSHGTHSYQSTEDWAKVLSAGTASGWRGGFLTQGQYNQLSDTGRNNYQNFVNTYNQQNGTNVTGGIPGAAPAPRQESEGGGGLTVPSATAFSSPAANQAAYEREAYGSPAPAPAPEPDRGNRQGSGTGGQARSGEYVSSDHDWSAPAPQRESDSGGSSGGK